MTKTLAIPANRPFSRAEAEAAGLPIRQLTQRCLRLYRGIYVSRDAELTPQLRGRAALLVVGEGRLSHASAARLYGLPVDLPADEHVTVQRRLGRKNRVGLAVHFDRDPSQKVLGGLPVSTPIQLCVELASELSLVELVVAYDCLLRREWITLDELRSVVQRARGVSGERARQAAGLARERVDSPMESRLRVLLVFAGVPCPEVNLTFRIDGKERRYDLCWPGVRVIVEYDGRPHIEREEQWQADLGRREGIENNGWRVLVVTGRDFYREPEELIRRVWRVLDDRGLAGLGCGPSAAWRQHFG